LARVPRAESTSFQPLLPDSPLTGGFEAAEMVGEEFPAQVSTSVSHSGYVAKAASPYSAPPSFFWLFKHLLFLLSRVRETGGDGWV